MQRIHFVASVIFFGLVPVVICESCFEDVLNARSYGSALANVVAYGWGLVFLLASIAGLTVEIICERRSRRWTRLR
jgi:hypothetical protein